MELTPEEMAAKITELQEALTSANGEAAGRRTTNKELKDQLAQFEGIDPVKAKEDREKAATLEQERLKDAGKFEEALAEGLKTLRTENDTLKTMLQGKDDSLASLTIDTAFLSAIDGKAVNNEQVLALVRGNMKMEDGKPVIYDGDKPKLNTKGERMSVADYGLEFLQNNPHLAKRGDPGSGSQGNGGDGGKGGNTISRADFNKMSPAQQSEHCKTGTITD